MWIGSFDLFIFEKLPSKLYRFLERSLDQKLGHNASNQTQFEIWNCQKSSRRFLSKFEAQKLSKDKLLHNCQETNLAECSSTIRSHHNTDFNWSCLRIFTEKLYKTRREKQIRFSLLELYFFLKPHHELKHFNQHMLH